jgi:flagellar hook-associated protein 1
MGLINGALEIGKNALLAYQSALQVTGNNVTNAGSDTYTRQTPVLRPTTGVLLPEGFQPGGGVALQALKRNVDESVQNRLRIALGDSSRSQAEQQALGQIESVMNELSDYDLSTLMQQFFNTFSSLQNDPANLGSRDVALTAGSTLAAEIQRQRGEVLGLRDELNKELDSGAQDASELVEKIRDLNVQITEVEGTSQGGANSLRDQRDQYLSQLSELMGIQVREQSNGSLNVYVGNELLIQGGISRGITSTLDNKDGNPRVVVRFADDNGPVPLTSGKLAGLVTARDRDVLGQIDRLNGLASNLINEVNKVHASGQGLEDGGWYSDVLGTYAVLDPAATLNSAQAGLSLSPQNGSFLMTVTDSTGVATTTTVTVDLDGIGADDSLNDLAARINATVANVTATVTADNRLQLTAADGDTLTFADDTANVLAALGINTFFSGKDAQDIEVNPLLVDNPARLAVAKDSTPGDGSNAAQIAALGSEPVSAIGGQSLLEFYNSIANEVAVNGAAAKASVDARNAIVMTLTSQRESISGVSLDEETVSLLKLERSFQGAARYTSTVDQMIQELLSLMR